MHKTLLEALNNRYATKQFDSNKKILKKDLETILESIRLTPTSFGIQLMKVVVVESKSLREELFEYSYDQKQIIDASHLLILCREKHFLTKHIDEYMDNISKIRDVKPSSLDSFKDMVYNYKKHQSQEQEEVWMTNQVYIALGNLLTSCAILNIDSCPIEGFNPEKYDEILELENDNLKSVLVIPIGYSSPFDHYKNLKKVRRIKNDFIIIK